METIGVFSGPLAILAFQAVVLWGFSIPTKDSSLMDRFWGISFTFCLLPLFPWHDLTKVGLVLAVFLWGSRLSWHITRRNWGKGEDARYAKLRERNPYYRRDSLVVIFLFQGFLVFLLSLPLMVFLHSSTPLHPFFFTAGLCLWALGWSFEVVADRQMNRSKKTLQPGGIVDTGLWSICRHPNYLGEVLLWGGFWVMTLPLTWWWGWLSPFFIAWLLLRFSGVEHLERHMMRTRPAYAEYCQRVPALWPFTRPTPPPD